MQESQFSSGGVIIKREESSSFKVLLVEDRFGHWTWPKGHIEKGETPEDTAVREITEETGLKNIKILEKLGEERYHFTLKGKRISKTVQVFLVLASGSESLEVPEEELRSAEWYLPEEAAKKVGYKSARAFVEKGIKVFREKHERQ